MTDDEFLPSAPTALTLSPGTAAGLAGLLIGCTLLLSACVLMVFNVILFSRGLRGVPIALAQIGGVIGVAGVALLGGLAVVLGLRSWVSGPGESATLGAAATAASAVGQVAWLIAGIDLLMILFM
jgi:hypothetical protein